MYTVHNGHYARVVTTQNIQYMYARLATSSFMYIWATNGCTFGNKTGQKILAYRAGAHVVHVARNYM